ncbi:MAG: HEAT repeat domain-containing protein, partial [Chloroflexi bacterium]|nr:HEAT repeat domain-containing protein [Chloroflexota bacterium]
MLSITHFTISYLPVTAPQPWRFDPLSALIGAGIALLLAWLVYNFRNELRLGWKTTTAPLLKLRHRLQASAEDRYRELVVAKARSLTISAHVTPLDAVFVEPDLLASVSPSLSTSETELAPAALQKLPLRRILGGHPLLAILGEPGTGKTASLAYLALSCARSAPEAGDAEIEATPGPAQKRLPLYVPLPAMDWGEQDEAKNNDGTPKDKPKRAKQGNDQVERLISAAVAAVGGKGGLASPLRQSLEAGQAIVLADGWDELLPGQRQQATDWLAELIAAWPGNLWLVAAGTRGYAPLTEAGFVPLTLAPWSVVQVEQFARHWVEAYTPEDQAVPVSVHRLTVELQNAARMGLAPLELALRAFVYLADQKPPARRAALFDRALELLLWQEKEEDAWVSATCRMALGQLASQFQQEKRITGSREEIEAAIGPALPPSEELAANATTRAFRALTGERGLLRLEGDNRYAFAHPLWQAYLAARQLITVAPATLIERLDDPYWAETLRFYTELGDMGPLVTAWLRTPDDMFYTRMRALGSWISVAPADAAWRSGAMAVLARAFLKPGHPAQVQQALAEALATTRVPGVAYLFKQALEHPDAEVRAAAVLGLARVAGEADMPTLEAALEDESPTVREAAVRGLSYLDVD